MKGYNKFAQTQSKTKQKINEILEEYPQMQKSAYEAKYAANQLEKLFNTLYTLTMGLGDVVGGLKRCLLNKGIIEQEDLNHQTDLYIKERHIDELEYKINQLGFGPKIEEVQAEGSLVLVQFGWGLEEAKELKQEKPYFFITGKVYLYPGFEEQLVGMKVNEEKEFTLAIPTPFIVKEIEGKRVTFHVTVLDIRSKIQ